MVERCVPALEDTSFETVIVRWLVETYEEEMAGHG